MMWRAAWIGLIASVIALPRGVSAQSVDWPNVGNDKGGTRHSTLTQINRDTVGRLQVAWMYHTGDAGELTTIECTPIVVNGVMYVTTVKTKVVALDAATGKVKWAFDPYPDPEKQYLRASGGVNRGVAYWSDGKPKGQRRVLVGLADGRLMSLDADTGDADKSFGDNGAVDLRKGIERDISRLGYGPTSAPMVFEDLVILGFSNDESMPAAPGDVRAFDVRSGREVWRFHTIPRPGEANHETWQGDQWKNRGGANPWGGFTLDVETATLFCGTGSVVPDFHGAGRVGPNLYGNCVLALDARTGKLKWHFQTVHHDLWDHDNPCPPVVVKVKHDGKDVNAVAQVTKTGYCYLLDRDTGKPLFGVKEVPAVASDVAGEQASPTQPIPLKPPPFSRQAFTDDEATNLSPAAHEFVLNALKQVRHGKQFIPPSEQGSVVIPGFHGGATWSGASFDPATGRLYVNSNSTTFIAALQSLGDGTFGFRGYRYFNDDKGYPAIKPPWGQLTSIDLNVGEFAWQKTLGEVPELTARGVPQTGTENFGGTIVTAGGLVFIGGTKDEKFHAFDSATGKLLWDYKLPAGGYATPSTYMVNGRQYVAIATGGGGKLKTRSGDAFVAFALPAEAAASK